MRKSCVKRECITRCCLTRFLPHEDCPPLLPAPNRAADCRLPLPCPPGRHPGSGGGLPAPARRRAGASCANGGSVDADSLSILRHRDHEDSLRAWWQRTYAERGATLSQHYQDCINRVQDGLSVDAIRLNTIASAYDTTRLGTQVAHTWQ